MIANVINEFHNVRVMVLYIDEAETELGNHKLRSRHDTQSH